MEATSVARFVGLAMLVALLGTGAVGQGHNHEVVGYRVGENVTLQCKQGNQWIPGPVCSETGEPLTFTYGVDSFASCGLHVKDEDAFNKLAARVMRQETWECRVAMVPNVPPGHDWYVPFNIIVWGVVEADHMHIDNHLNYVFHAMSGRILGIAAYPVRGRLQLAKLGSILTLHGPAKWFNGHTYLPFSSAGRPADGGGSAGDGVFVVVCCILTLMLSALGFTFLYKFYLRKRLVRKMLKKD